jgi:hypothetical protein
MNELEHIKSIATQEFEDLQQSMSTYDVCRDVFSDRPVLHVQEENPIEEVPMPEDVVSDGLEVKKQEFVDRVHVPAPGMRRENGHFILCLDDLYMFEREATACYAEADEDSMRRLYIGMGLAGSAIATMLAGKRPQSNPRKSDAFGEQLRDFFSSHDDIEETFRALFSRPGFESRAHMVHDISDKRAIQINGARLRLGLLASMPSVMDYIGTEPDKLTEGARADIVDSYRRDIDHYFDILTLGLSQSPDKVDKNFFTGLSDFVIAAATPIDFKRATSHLFSEGWQRD